MHITKWLNAYKLLTPHNLTTVIQNSYVFNTVHVHHACTHLYGVLLKSKAL